MRVVYVLVFLLACSSEEAADVGIDGGARDARPGADTSVSDAPPPGDTGVDASERDSSMDRAPATIVESDSCSQEDVEAAIARAEAGDVVRVPPGTCTWSSMVLDAPIHLQGSGVDETTVAVTEIAVRKQASGIVRVSGFTFERSGGGNASKGFRVEGSWRDAQPVVFESNRFIVRGSGLFVLDVVGGVIIARNEFDGELDDSFIQPKNIGDPDGSWTSDHTMGDRDVNGTLNHYIEDNVFVGGANQGIDADDATRVVYRYNRLVHSSFNSHGFATSSDGVRHFEVYENEFIHEGGMSPLENQNWSIWIRGGTGVIFRNRLADIAGSHWGDKAELRFTIRGAEDVRPQGECNDVGYPVPRQLGQGHDGAAPINDPIYIWENTGAQATSAGWSWGNPCGLEFDDFFQWGRDAFNDGTSRPGYTPFVYPHPLVTP
ncbi:MAG: hypothetical protein AAF938_03550 [Myxococcota bacterium]